jgi:hypothetical protein
MRRGPLLVVVAIACALSVFATSGTAWAATKWIAHVATTTSGESHAQTLPAAPTGATATCAAPTTSKTISVTWSAVAHATAYAVYESTTTATGTYTLTASGVATTTWTSGALTAGTHYWFEVLADVGTNWASAKSSATAQRTINSANPFCS